MTKLWKNNQKIFKSDIIKENSWKNSDASKNKQKEKRNFACYTTITVLSLLLLLWKSHSLQKTSHL